MHLFVQKWIPSGAVPDQQTLSGPILKQEAAKVEDQLKMKLDERLTTFMTDGWKNKAKQSIVASMVSVASEVSSGIKLSITCTHLNLQPYLMCMHDVSEDAKSGKGLLKLVTKDIHIRKM